MQGESEAVSQTNEMTVTCEDPDEPGKPQAFTFDRVFGPEDAQEVVFDEMRTLCLSALDGFNVCLFAYGITGSGKTFTVEGMNECTTARLRRFQHVQTDLLSFLFPNTRW